METDLEFFTRRGAEERRAAEQALSPEAKLTHQALADEYKLKEEQLAGGETSRSAAESASSDN